MRGALGEKGGGLGEMEGSFLEKGDALGEMGVALKKRELASGN